MLPLQTQFFKLLMTTEGASKHLVSSSMGPLRSLAMVLSSPQHSLDYIAQWLLGVLLI